MDGKNIMLALMVISPTIFSKMIFFYQIPPLYKWVSMKDYCRVFRRFLIMFPLKKQVINKSAQV
jgi:hypothetical protein